MYHLQFFGGQGCFRAEILGAGAGAEERIKRRIYCLVRSFQTVFNAFADDLLMDGVNISRFYIGRVGVSSALTRGNFCVRVRRANVR
jgi:hypothetical protein